LQLHAIEQVPRKGFTREDIRVLRDEFRFLLENCEIDGDHYDAAECPHLHAFVYGSTEESTAAFFWMASGGLYWNERRVLLDLDVVVLDDDTSYLLKSGKFDNATKIERLAMEYTLNATANFSHSARNTRVLGELVAGAMHSGCDLHGREDDISPLLRLLHREDKWMSAEYMEARLYAWLALLKSIGVDLHTYGQEEWDRFRALRRDCERPWDWWHGAYPHRCEDLPSHLSPTSYRHEIETKPTVSAFSYGADVSDWKLWILHHGDQYAGQFWRLIEKNGIFNRHVPGGWVEAE
jgi:hypothetical protein